MFFDVVRVLTIVVGVGSLAVLALRFHRWFCRRPSCMVTPLVGLVVSAVLTYAAAESLAVGAPGGLRTVLLLVGQLALLVNACTVTDNVSCRVGATGRWALPRARR